MNLHVPQSVEAEIEIMVNSRCANHIVSSQSNAPVNGPVQDALVGIYMLTRHWNNGTITLVSKRTALKIYQEMEISSEDVQNLWQRAKEYYPEYIINNEDGKLTIQEEIPGNLFVSILFPRDLCYSRTIENQNPKYTQVEIEDGVLLAESCHLCAKTAGGKPNSLVHILWKQSPELCLRFMSNLQQLTDRWLMTHGFSMGIADCYASKSAAVAQTLLETRSQVDEVLNNPPENKSPAQIEGIIQTVLNGAMNIGPKLAKDSMMKDDFNALNIMRNSGAKGSVINLSQIVAMVGQQNIKGCRMPQQLSHGSRCLPSFLKGDNTPDARGFVEHNYIQGLTPQEAFFHAAAGRDGVISTALKTADTGYLQKRMGRKLEDAKVWSDGSIRDAHGSIISFLYGDDGMEAKKLVPVKGLNAPFFVNPYLLARQLNSQVKQSQDLDKGQIRFLSSEEIQFMCEYINFSHIQSDPILLATQNTRDTLSKVLKNVQIYESKIADFIVEIKNAYDNSKAPYGYAAGLVSTSSLGEPNSQSTLNVFHLTGVGSGKSESVGVARFRELINATKTLKQAHPGCSIYFKDQTLVQNSKLVSQLEEQNKTQPSPEIENQIKTVKEESLRFIESKANVFEQTYVKQFLKDYELKYLPIDSVAPQHSPTGLFTYQEYKEEWWVTLSKKLGVNEKENFKDVAKSWVLVLYFDVEKLYKARIDLEDISFAIEDTSMCALSCIISPTIIGRIEVYADIEQIRSHMKLKFTNKVGSIITPENSAYYIMRDPITKFVKNTRITGVEGVVKTYSREELSTHEWIMDTDGANFLDILTMPNVDTVRTMTNDMHEILKVLGVEAARRFEFEEITRVISYDGTYINPRHISTLVDVMTASGGLTAASRDGISRDVVGPNAKIMFEKSVDNAMIASAFGDVDNMTSLASSVMFGKVAITGSKMVEICTHNSLGRQPPLKVKTIPLKTRK